MSAIQKASMSRVRRNESLIAYLFIAPAAIGLFIFMIVPFLMAFYLSLTDTRLMSPNAAEFIGLENYRNLLKVRIIQLEPLLNPETGEIELDENGDPAYPRSREVLRASEETKDFRELNQIDLFGKHYLIAAGDPVFWIGMKNNFYFVFVVVPLQTAFALMLAILVNQKLKGSNLFRALYFTPVVVPMVVVAVIWFFLYNPGVGTINVFLERISFGLIGPQEWLVNPKLAFPSIMLLSIWQGVGFQMVIFLAGLQEIPPEIYEAGAIDGCNKIQEFFFLTLPQLKNTTIFVLISTTILAFQLFTQVDIMTGGGPSNASMTTILHVVNEGRRQLRAGYASSVTVVFFLVVLAVSILQRVIVKEERQVK